MDKTCQHCNKSFRVALYRKDTAKFCSISCHSKSKVGEKGAHWKGGKPRCACGKLLNYQNKVCQSCEVRTGENNHFFGKSHSLETKQRFSILRRGQNIGSNHHLWIQDRSKLQRYNDEAKDRRSSAYRDWRMQVWRRDGFKCKIANTDCNGRIEAHHILGYKEYPELRYQLNNGITLCHAHHPRKRAEEKRLVPTFKELVSVSNALI